METDKQNPSPQRIKNIIKTESKNSDGEKKELTFIDLSSQYLQEILDSEDLDIYRAD
jgi:hypothetical protein